MEFSVKKCKCRGRLGIFLRRVGDFPLGVPLFLVTLHRICLTFSQTITMMKKIALFCMLCLLAATAQSATRSETAVKPDKNNQKIISQYNRCHKSIYMYPDQRLSKDFTAIFWVDENSVMSTPDIEVTIVKKRIDNAIYNDKEDRVYFVQIKNKTDQPIYIDRGSCYRTDSDGARHCYYDAHNPTDSLHKQRVLTIPPRATRNLTDYRWIRNPQNNIVEIVEYPEEFAWNLEAVGITVGYVHNGESRLFTEKTSPFRRTFQICYSKESDFATYSMAQINCYIREIIGCYYPENYQYDKMKSRLQVEGVDEYSITSWVPLY